MEIHEIMTRHPISLHESDPIREVISILQQHDIRHLPVTDSHGALVGIISDRDLRSFSLPLSYELDHPNATERRLATPVSVIMRSDVPTVAPEADVEEVLDLMVNEKVGAVPIVEPNSNKLLGIVSYIDLLKFLQNHLSLMDAA